MENQLSEEKVNSSHLFTELEKTKSTVSELQKDYQDSKMALQKLTIEHDANTKTIERMNQ